MEPAPVTVILARMAVISWFVAVFSWLFDPAGFVLGVYLLGVVALGAIVGTAVYGLALLLKSQVDRTNPPGEARKRSHDSLDLLADERRRDKIFGVQWIQSFLPDSDAELKNELFGMGKDSTYAYFGRFGFGGQPSNDRKLGLRWVLRQPTQRPADHERARVLSEV